MDGAEILRAELLTRAGFAHGFSTRRGGTSEGAYASLNVGRSVGDRPESVAENHARLAKAIGYEPDKLFEVSQVHGNAVVTVRWDERPEPIRTQQADALLAHRAGTAVGVRTADCVPVLLADPGTGMVAAVHAGWRGVVAEVVRAAVRAFEGREPDALRAAIGPAIGPCCFEVGDDVAAELARVAGDGIVVRRGGSKPHVDLFRAVEHQLRRLGIREIETVGGCTMCHADRFFSFRRDGAKSGRMLAAIVARGTDPR